MFKNKTFQVKMVKDSEVGSEPSEPVRDPAEVAQEIVEHAAMVAVLAYTVCKSVDFWYRMSEHFIIRRYPV